MRGHLQAGEPAGLMAAWHRFAGPPSRAAWHSAPDYVGTGRAYCGRDLTRTGFVARGSAAAVASVTGRRVCVVCARGVARNAPAGVGSGS
jgi:hypothetical protein